MDIEQTLALTLASIITLTIPTLSHGKNCIKGKPCGKGCIALDKTCRIDTSPGSNGNVLRYDLTANQGTIIRRSVLRLPKVAVVTADSVYAKQSPYSKKITRRYTQGQRVFVYETDDTWARVSNMQPEEWVKLEALRLK